MCFHLKHLFHRLQIIVRDPLNKKSFFPERNDKKKYVKCLQT